MTEELFTAYRSQLPQHVQDDFDDDEVVMLRSGKTIEDLVHDGTKSQGFEEFYAFCKKRVVFITPDTAISASLDTPSHHPYTIDATFTIPDTATDRTLHISGINAEGTSPALSFLLRFILASERNNTQPNDEKNARVTFKCFPMTPRQQLGSLDLSPLANLGEKRKIDSLVQSSSCIDIEFRFLALRQGHCKLLFYEHSNLFSRVKFSQCNVEEWKAFDETTSFAPKASQQLALSCTQQEFRKFAKGQLLASTSICELHLLLHFMLADEDVQHLRSIIETTNSRLQSLKFEFLDIDDKIWTMVCESLQKNKTLQHIDLSYTEKFADAYRRLTPERRRDRTNDIIKLLHSNKSLQVVSWPKFQQDESLMPEIERLLMENKKTGVSSSPSS